MMSIIKSKPRELSPGYARRLASGVALASGYIPTTLKKSMTRIAKKYGISETEFIKQAIEAAVEADVEG